MHTSSKSNDSTLNNKAGEMDNIPPLVRKFEISTGGEDTAHIHCLGEYKHFDGLLNMLEQRKQSVQKDINTDENSIELENGEIWYVQPRGMGGRGGGAYFPYCLKSKGITIGIGSSANYDPKKLNMKVEFGSVVLMDNDGLYNCWQTFKETQECLGYNMRDDKISRVDMCVDLPNEDLAEIMPLLKDHQFASNLRSISDYEDLIDFHSFGYRDTGFSIGKTVKFRFYEKLVELRQSRDTIKHGVMIGRRFGGVEPDKAIRVEAQMRREYLKQFVQDGRSLNSTDDYLEMRASIWRELCEGSHAGNRFKEPAFRLLDKNYGKKNTHKAKVHPFWQKVIDYGYQWIKSEPRPITRFKGIPHADPSDLWSQAFGAAQAACLLEGNFDITGKLMTQRFDEELLIRKQSGEYTKSFHQKLREFQERYDMGRLLGLTVPAANKLKKGA